MFHLINTTNNTLGDDDLPKSKKRKNRHVKGAIKEKDQLGENKRDIEKRLVELYRKLAESELIANNRNEE